MDGEQCRCTPYEISKLCVLSAIIALLSGCLSHPLGYTKAEWDQISPAEQKQTRKNLNREGKSRVADAARERQGVQDTIKDAATSRLGEPLDRN